MIIKSTKENTTEQVSVLPPDVSVHELCWFTLSQQVRWVGVGAEVGEELPPPQDAYLKWWLPPCSSRSTNRTMMSVHGPGFKTGNLGVIVSHCGSARARAHTATCAAESLSTDFGRVCQDQSRTQLCVSSRGFQITRTQRLPFQQQQQKKQGFKRKKKFRD